MPSEKINQITKLCEAAYENYQKENSQQDIENFNELWNKKIKLMITELNSKTSSEEDKQPLRKFIGILSGYLEINEYSSSIRETLKNLINKIEKLDSNKTKNSQAQSPVTTVVRFDMQALDAQNLTQSEFADEHHIVEKFPIVKFTETITTIIQPQSKGSQDQKYLTKHRVRSKGFLYQNNSLTNNGKNNVIEDTKISKQVENKSARPFIFAKRVN